MRSGLEKEVAAILGRLKLEYTYEEDKLPYVIEHNYIPDSVSYTHLTLPTKA